MYMSRLPTPAIADGPPDYRIRDHFFDPDGHIYRRSFKDLIASFVRQPSQVGVENQVKTTVSKDALNALFRSIVRHAT